MSEDGEVDETHSPLYHPPVAEWWEEWKGLTWEDMCGEDEIIRKLNFALYRRGLYDPEIDCILCD